MSLPIYDMIQKGLQKAFKGQLTQNGNPVSNTNPLPVNVVSGDVGGGGGGTVELGATSLAALESITVSGPLTDTQLRATPVPISGTVSTGFSQPLTDTQLRATAVVVSPNVTRGLGNVDSNTQRVTLSNENIQDLYITGQAAQTATVNNIIATTAGTTPVDVQQYRSFAVQVVSTGTGGTFIFEGSNDGTNFQSIPVFNQALIAPVPIVTAITATASQIIYVGACIFRYMRLRIANTITGGSIQAFSSFSQVPFSVTQNVVAQGTAANLNATVTATNLSTNISQVAGATPINTISNGSSNRNMGVVLGTAVSNTDQNATAFAGSGRVNGTIVASTAGAGAVITAEINVSALTLGTATSVVFILQESNGGTNFTDIWTSDPVSTTSIIRVPAIPVAGRRRWCAFNIGGTSTTVTATITTLELPTGSYPIYRQFRDVFAATNPLSSTINSVVQTASTFGATTAFTATTQATTACLVEGTKVITAHLTLGGAPTVTTQPVFSLEFSNDLTNWFTSTSTMTAAGNGTYSVTLANVAWRYARIRVTTAAAYSAGAYTITSVGITGVN